MIFYLPLFALVSWYLGPPQQYVTASVASINSTVNPYNSIAAIPLPAGYKRRPVAAHSFAAWLRALPLKKDRTVYLFNGQPRANQAKPFAVVDISTGNKDLQQCADVVMRLRAEYLYAEQQFAAIDFTDNNQHHYRLPANPSRAAFMQYLENVFAFCGTASLEKQLTPLKNMQELEAGDVLIKGGSPGHAMLLADLAVNDSGDIIYLLVQGYMPAQDMHIVNNPLQPALGPWFSAKDDPIETPDWRFTKKQWRKWPVN